jgi:hypothetical protein
MPPPALETAALCFQRWRQYSAKQKRARLVIAAVARTLWPRIRYATTM